MTPQQKIKKLILICHEEFGNDPQTIQFAKELDAAGVDEQWDALSPEWGLQDAIEEVREGKERTGLPCQTSRHYESEAVAAQLPDGSWVGWTYWYGGGKHGEPEAIDWMSDAYDLTCAEEVRPVTVRTFTKVES